MFLLSGVYRNVLFFEIDVFASYIKALLYGIIGRLGVGGKDSKPQGEGPRFKTRRGRSFKFELERVGRKGKTHRKGDQRENPKKGPPTKRKQNWGTSKPPFLHFSAFFCNI